MEAGSLFRGMSTGIYRLDMLASLRQERCREYGRYTRLGIVVGRMFTKLAGILWPCVIFSGILRLPLLNAI